MLQRLPMADLPQEVLKPLSRLHELHSPRVLEKDVLIVLRGGFLSRLIWRGGWSSFDRIFFVVLYVRPLPIFRISFRILGGFPSFFLILLWLNFLVFWEIYIEVSIFMTTSTLERYMFVIQFLEVRPSSNY